MVTNENKTDMFSSMTTNHRAWLERVTGSESFREIGEKTGLHYSGIVRSLNRNGLSTEQVVQIAVAYKIPIVDALIDTGRINSNDVEPDSPERIAETISYLARKLATQAHPTPQQQEQTNVVHLHTNDVLDDFYSDELPEDAVAYPHEEIGGTLDDLDP